MSIAWEAAHGIDSCLDKVLDEWNKNQPAWHTFKRYDQLTASQQSVVDARAAELYKEGL